MEVQIVGVGRGKWRSHRLVGERLSASDRSFLAELHGDEQVMASHGGVQSEEVTDRFLRSNLAHWFRYNFGLWTLRPRDGTGDPIGWVALRTESSLNGSDSVGPVDVTCLLIPGHWGRGLGTEAVRAAVSIGLDEGLDLVANARASNASGRRIVEKTGFAYVGDVTRGNSVWARYQWPENLNPPMTLDRDGLVRGSG